MLSTFVTKEVTMSSDSTGLSIGTRWPALLTTLNYSIPALFIEPTTLLLTFQGVNSFLLNSSA